MTYSNDIFESVFASMEIFIQISLNIFIEI